MGGRDEFSWVLVKNDAVAARKPREPSTLLGGEGFLQCRVLRFIVCATLATHEGLTRNQHRGLNNEQPHTLHSPGNTPTPYSSA